MLIPFLEHHVFWPWLPTHFFALPAPDRSLSLHLAVSQLCVITLLGSTATHFSVMSLHASGQLPLRGVARPCWRMPGSWWDPTALKEAFCMFLMSYQCWHSPLSAGLKKTWLHRFQSPPRSIRGLMRHRAELESTLSPFFQQPIIRLQCLVLNPVHFKIESNMWWNFNKPWS